MERDAVHIVERKYSVNSKIVGKSQCVGDELFFMLIIPLTSTQTYDPNL